MPPTWYAATSQTTPPNLTKVELIDDLSGEKADETVTFGLDRVVYDIDFSANKAGDLRDIFGDYVNAGRKVSELTASSSAGTSRRITTIPCVRIEPAQRNFGLPPGYAAGRDCNLNCVTPETGEARMSRAPWDVGRQRSFGSVIRVYR